MYKYPVLIHKNHFININNCDYIINNISLIQKAHYYQNTNFLNLLTGKRNIEALKSEGKKYSSRDS